MLASTAPDFVEDDDVLAFKTTMLYCLENINQRKHNN